MLERRDPGQSREPDLDVIHVEVTAGYQPAVVRARAGVPIRVVFHRLDQDACTERVIFSSPRLERRLAASGATSVDLPAHQAGEIRYTCGMGRYSGIIRVVDVDSGRRGWLGRDIQDASSALSVAFIVAAVGLPIVAVMAHLLLDGATAAVATAVAAASVVIGVLWLLDDVSASRGGRNARGPSGRPTEAGPPDAQPTPSARRTR